MDTNAGSLRIYLEERRESGYYHLNGYVVTETNGTIRNTSSFWPNSTAGLDMDGLTAISQGTDGDATKHERGRHVYGWEVVYRDQSRISLRRIGNMAKTLRTVDRRMSREDEKNGPPESFGQFLGRFACAVGAVGFVVRKGPNNGWSYDDNAHRIMTIREGIEHANFMISTWAKEGRTADALAG